MTSVRKLTETWKQTKNLREESRFKNADAEKFKRTPESTAYSQFASQNADGKNATRAVGLADASTSYPRTSKRLAQKDTTSQGTPSQIQCKHLKFQTPDILKVTLPISNRSRTHDGSQKILSCAANSPSTPGNLLLSSWALPTVVLEKYEEYGIKNMFEWQAECLSSQRVLRGRNLIYSAPTSSGKTLVAEILMLKCVLERKKKAMMILPFVSVTHEKINNLRNLFRDTGIRVDGYMGNHSPPGGFAAVDIAVCTIEKANNLVNRLIEENELNSVGIIVVDELHMVGDPHRGYLLELLLTKIQYLQVKHPGKPGILELGVSLPIQIIGMSATLPNLNLLATWLDAELYCTDFRPVPLTECLKIGANLYRADSMEFLRDLPKAVSVKDDQDHVVQLCLETICDGHGVLIFCPTKAWCEKLAETIARAIYELGKDDFQHNGSRDLARMHEKIRKILNMEKLSETLGHLRSSPAGLDKALSQTISFGVAFHHAGLTFDERDIIEGSFRQGTIKVLTATSTLSSGVNLPARRVIIRTPIFHGGALISVLSYKQMVGRAGRKGLDDAGESILICSENDKHRACALTQSQMPPVRSCLQVDGNLQLSSSLKRAVLEIIVSGVATTLQDVHQYVDRTLLAASASENCIEGKVITDCLHFLTENEFISMQVTSCSRAGMNSRNKENLQDAYVSTSLGSAVLASALSPDEGLIVFQELERARRCFVLENELHVIYQVTPIYLSEQWSSLDWHHYWQMWEGLAPSFKRVGECVGVEERFLMRASRQGTSFSLTNPKQNRQLGVHLRFYTALALHDLVNEMPLSAVAHKFSCNRGMLQSLQQAAGTFAGMVTVFCHKLGWTNMELLLAHFQNRLHFGIQQELCDLVRISCLNGLIARTLFNAGYKSVAAIANTTVLSVEKVLRHAGPFESAKAKEDETAKEAMKRVESRAVWLPGRKNITERQAARIIIDEAREIVSQEFGVKNIDWAATNDDFETNSKDNDKVTRATLENESVVKLDLDIIPVTVASENAINDTQDLFLEQTSSLPGCLHAASGHQTLPTDRVVEIRGSAQTEINPENISMPLDSSHYTTVQRVTTPQECCPVVLPDSESPIAASLTEQDGRPSHVSHTSQDGLETSNSLFDDELVLNTQVFENCDNPTTDRRIEKHYFTQSPSVVSLQLDENNDISAFDGHNYNYTLDSTAFSEARSLNLSVLSDSDCTPSFIVIDKEDNTRQIATRAPQETSEHSNSNDDVFINDSLFDCSGAFHSKEVGDPTDKVDEDKCKKTSVGSNGNYSIANIDGFSEELFTRPASMPEVLESSDKSSLLKNSSLEGGDLDVAVIFETQDMFSEELDFPVLTTRTVNLSKEKNPDTNGNTFQIEQEKPNCVDVLDEENYSQIIPPTPTKPGSRNVTLFASSRSTCMLRSLGPKTSNVASDFPAKNIPDVSEVETTNIKNNVSKHELISSTPTTVDSIEDHRPSAVVKIIRQSLPRQAKTMNVFADKAELEKFMQTWSTKSRFAFAFAGEKHLPDLPVRSMIGHNILKSKNSPQKTNGILPKPPVITVNAEDVAIVGMAVCWDSTPYYIDFLPKDNFSNKARIIELNNFFINLSMHFNPSQPTTVISYDLKEQLRALFHICDVLPSNILGQDPRVASWLLDPESSKLTIYELVEKNLPHRLCLLKDFTTINHQGSLAFYVQGQKSACVRAVAEVVSALELMEQLSHKMQDAGLMTAFHDIEMASLIPLIKLELNGFGVCVDELERQRVLLETKLCELENFAFALAGHEFQLASAKEVAKVLYSELKLPAQNVIFDTEEQQSPIAMSFRSRRLCGSSTNILKKLRPRGQAFPGKTNKSTLQKFGDCHDLPNVVIEWRQINNALNKILIPMADSKHYDGQLKMHRLFSTYSTFTATGRVASADPSVQMVPRDFTINLAMESLTGGEGSSKIPKKTPKNKAFDKHSTSNLEKSVVMSPRHAFIASRDAVLVAADYSQLELRILAHLSQDEDLIMALNNDTDVFKSIAAKWKGCEIGDVTDDLRQQAKQICYGMIYGVGAKSLGESLHVNEEQAGAFIESFKSKYPGIQKFIRSTVDKCKKCGYVETIMGRRRYLPSISSHHFQAQQHAERQAVNTTVQGSAADIVKKAMIGIDKQLEEEFPQTKKPLRRNFCTEDGTFRSTPGFIRGGFLVLQLHDELIYETSEEDAIQVAQIVKMNMERTTQLSVKLTIKTKFGPTWGTLKEVDI